MGCAEKFGSDEDFVDEVVIHVQLMSIGMWYGCGVSMILKYPEQNCPQMRADCEQSFRTTARDHWQSPGNECKCLRYRFSQ
jgi:hypothetical protein